MKKKVVSVLDRKWSKELNNVLLKLRKSNSYRYAQTQTPHSKTYSTREFKFDLWLSLFSPGKVQRSWKTSPGHNDMFQLFLRSPLHSTAFFSLKLNQKKLLYKELELKESFLLSFYFLFFFSQTLNLKSDKFSLNVFFPPFPYGITMNKP